MKLVAQIKLFTDKEQAKALLETMHKANAACNFISETAWTEKVFGQFRLHKLCYYSVKEKFDLTAQVAVQCIKKVCDAYKLDKKTKREFRKEGAISYDDRILSFTLPKSQVSIWTVHGRKKIPFVCGERQKELLKTRQGESDLVYRKGVFYLFVTCNVDEPTESDFSDTLGIDLGVKSIATLSDGTEFSSLALNTYRLKRHRIRKSLQSKAHKGKRSTRKNCRRLLKRLGKKESNFATNVNHTISKRIVDIARERGMVIVLEDLKGIRQRTLKRLRKSQRGLHSSWAFYQLRTFLIYKARLAGVPLVLVNPRYTSQTCNVCKHIGYRKGKVFDCPNCGYHSNADLNAAKVIAAVGASVDTPENSAILSCALHKAA